MRRARPSPAADKAYFRHTADRTRALNLNVVNYRGGVRL